MAFCAGRDRKARIVFEIEQLFWEGKYDGDPTPFVVPAGETWQILKMNFIVRVDVSVAGQAVKSRALDSSGDEVYIATQHDLVAPELFAHTSPHFGESQAKEIADWRGVVLEVGDKIEFSGITDTRDNLLHILISYNRKT